MSTFKVVDDLDEAELLLNAGLLWWRGALGQEQPAIEGWKEAFEKGHDTVHEWLGAGRKMRAYFGVMVE